MTDILFLKALRDKLKGGNIRSIHLNALPGRYATRLDLAQLNIIHSSTAANFLNTLLAKSSFEFSINFDKIDLNGVSLDEQKKLGLLAKRLNSLHFENEDFYKEHGSKTFGFGYPLLIKRSKKDINKVIKAPLFIWPLEIIKSTNKVNTWSILRNKVKNDAGKVVEEEIHLVGINEVLTSFLQADEGISLPQINEDFLEDAVVTKDELLNACYTVLTSLNALSDNTTEHLRQNFGAPIESMPDANHFETLTSNNNPWIHFGGVFGLFRVQKESIITDIDQLIERFTQFQFENLKVDGFCGTSLSSVETDPSQQQILNTLGADPKKIIQGPPGTGKSQSLTALITNALANGLKCLVVCEKKTALDVIKNNLHKENEKLGELAAIIEDISKDRDVIVNSVRDRISTLRNDVPLTDVRYQTIKGNIESSIAQLNEEHNKLDRKIFAGKTWSQLTGEYLQKCRKAQVELLKDKLNQKEFSFDDEGHELANFLTKLSAAKRLFRAVKTLHHPLDLFSSSVFKGDNIRAAQMEVEENCQKLRSLIHTGIALSQEYKAQLAKWKNYRVIEYHYAVQGVCMDYMQTVDGSRLFNGDRVPDQLPLELEISEAISSLNALKKSAENEKASYRDWLTDHYSGYYSQLKETSLSYVQFADSNHQEYGELFFKNTSLARFQIGALSLILGRYKVLKENRQKLFIGFEQVKEVHSSYAYVEHEYVPVKEDMYLKGLVENIKSLHSVTETWYKGHATLIESYLARCSSATLHSEYSEKAAHFRQLENQGQNFISTLVASKLTQQSLPGSFTVDELINVYNLVFRDLEAVLQNIKKFKAEYRQLIEVKLAVEEKHQQTITFLEESNLLANPPAQCFSLSSLETFSDEVLTSIDKSLECIDEFRTFFEWKQFLIGLTPLEDKVIKALIATNDQNWENVFEVWYYFWLLAKHEITFKDIPENDELIDELFKLKAELRDTQVRSILRAWTSRQTDAMRGWQRNGLTPVSLYNKRGARGERRNSLRKIIRTDFGFFTSFFPVLLVSPSVCSSVIPLEEGLFDLVIFDEASQLRLEDTFPSLIRGKYKIISGDSQQMPPSSYFQGGGTLINPEEETEEYVESPIGEAPTKLVNSSLDLADSESLLVYAENSNYRQSFLKVHYRSQHPGLIDFSNHAFYGKRLIPMPPKKEYTPIQFVEVNGLYDEQVNKDEAAQVVDILLHHIRPLSNGKMPSVGVATFNLYQRNLILEEIIKARQSNPKYDKRINDLGADLFVKNLENIQGDERDIMIISTTFGKRPDGSFRQHFGPILQKNGYKLLNVIITRAKYKVFVVSSIPFEHINKWSTLLQAQRNNGRAVFYSYLAYAKAVNDGNNEVRDSILEQLYLNCESKVFEIESDVLGSESPFEEEVYYRLAERIGQSRIEQQYRIGGFRVDMVIRSKSTDDPIIAIECDGAKYHSSHEAYAWDMFRQKQIEQYGLKFHRIWSTNWWLAPQKELDRLVQFIHEHESAGTLANGIGDMSLFSFEPIESPAISGNNKKVEKNSTVTVRSDGKSVFKIRFSDPSVGLLKMDGAGCVVVSFNSVIAEALLGHIEGDVCKLGSLDNYYEILKIE